MSREIKFRAWDEDCEVMYYSDKEYEECNDGCSFGFHEGRVVAWLRETESQTLDEPAYDYGKPVDVEQYTGLKDKNGVEIWEGDLIKTVDETLKVAWHFNRWVMKDAKGRIKEFRQIDQGFYKVIGNIHQNPELLEIANE